MPVDESLQTTWPDFYREYKSSDNRPSTTVLADPKTAGAYAVISGLTVLAASTNGSRGAVQKFDLAVLRSNASTTLRKLDEQSDTWGLPGIGIAVDVAGDEVVLTTTGLSGVELSWQVLWTLIGGPTR